MGDRMKGRETEEAGAEIGVFWDAAFELEVKGQLIP